MNIGDRIKAAVLALILQFCIACLTFIGGLLDPLIALWMAGGYFFLLGTYLAHYYLLRRIMDYSENTHSMQR